MFQSIQAKRNSGEAGSSEISMAPLIDMVFILLIFFLVTTSFVSDSGIEIERAAAVTAGPLSPDALRISIASSGDIYIKGASLPLHMLEGELHGFLSRRPNGVVVVIPDKRTPSGALVEVMDIAKVAGAQDIAVATE